MRLDVYLVENGMLKSRSLAKNLIKDQKVLVNGVPAKKAGLEVEGSDEVKVLEEFKFVSRAGYKLEKALESFNINVEGKVGLDVGASTGGFTDCLIQRGANLVYSIDVGEGQMDSYLKQNPKVRNFEKVNARHLDDLIRTKLFPEFDPNPQIVVSDLSFISVILVLPAVLNSVPDGTEFVVLVKPQFELGQEALNKKGVVTDNRVRIKALRKVEDFCKSMNLKIKGSMDSPIKGGDGNVEYLIYFQK